jgi:hypothetical protein
MGPPPVPRSPEDVFRDFRARRAGLIRALTTGNPRLAFRLRLTYLPPPSDSVWGSEFSLVSRWLSADVEKFYMMCDPGELELSLSACPALPCSALLPRFGWDF